MGWVNSCTYTTALRIPMPYAKYDTPTTGPINNDSKNPDFLFEAFEVGQYKLNQVDPYSLKAPGFNPRANEVKTRFQILLSTSTCTATSRRGNPCRFYAPRTRTLSASPAPRMKPAGARAAWTCGPSVVRTTTGAPARSATPPSGRWAGTFRRLSSV
jgi:hypothetical protein